MVADTAQVVKEVKRSEPAKLTEQERELQHALEASAKAFPESQPVPVAPAQVKERMLADAAAASVVIVARFR